MIRGDGAKFADAIDINGSGGGGTPRGLAPKTELRYKRDRTRRKPILGSISAAFGALPKGGHLAPHHPEDHGRPAQALYEQVRNHLAAFGDLWLALETDRDYANAKRLAVEFGEDFRLLEDLGWDPNDGRFTVELTMD